MSAWIGVDFDGTLAEYHGWNDGLLGAPIAPMVALVKSLLAEGKEVRIFTARVSHNGNPLQVYNAEHQRQRIEEWCRDHIGKALPVTNVKDLGMVVLYDDRARQVISNTGEVVHHKEYVMEEWERTVFELEKMKELR